MAESMAYADFKENGSEAACKVRTFYDTRSIICAHVDNSTPANFFQCLYFFFHVGCLSFRPGVHERHFGFFLMYIAQQKFGTYK